MSLFGKNRPELIKAILAGFKISPQDVISDVKRACKLVGMLACAPSFQTEVILPSEQKYKES
jgi:hypothetical protein